MEQHEKESEGSQTPAVRRARFTPEQERLLKEMQIPPRKSLKASIVDAHDEFNDPCTD